MAIESLKLALVELKTVLSSNNPLSPELLEILRSLDCDIRAKLDEQTSSPAVVPSTELLEKSVGVKGLANRTQEISAKFAAEYPHLEPLLRELTNTLQRIGI